MQQMPLPVLFSAVPSPFPIIAPPIFHPFPSQSSFLLPFIFSKEVCGSFTCPSKMTAICRVGGGASHGSHRAVGLPLGWLFLSILVTNSSHSCLFNVGTLILVARQPSGQRAGFRRGRAWVQIAVATLSGNSLGQTVHTHCASVHQAAKLAAALLRVAGVTAGLAESNGRLRPGL